MRFSAPIIAYFFSVNNICKIYPLNNINTHIYHYKPQYDQFDCEFLITNDFEEKQGLSIDFKAILK